MEIVDGVLHLMAVRGEPAAHRLICQLRDSGRHTNGDDKLWLTARVEDAEDEAEYRAVLARLDSGAAYEEFRFEPFRHGGHREYRGAIMRLSAEHRSGRRREMEIVYNQTNE